MLQTLVLLSVAYIVLLISMAFIVINPAFDFSGISFCYIVIGHVGYKRVIFYCVFQLGYWLFQLSILAV